MAADDVTIGISRERGVANCARRSIRLRIGGRSGYRRPIAEALTASLRSQVNGGDPKRVERNQLSVDGDLEFRPARVARIKLAVAVGVEDILDGLKVAGGS